MKFIGKSLPWQELEKHQRLSENQSVASSASTSEADDDFNSTLNSTTSNELMRSDVAEMGLSDLEDDSSNNDQLRMYASFGGEALEGTQTTSAAPSLDVSVDNVSVESAGISIASSIATVYSNSVHADSSAIGNNGVDARNKDSSNEIRNEPSSTIASDVYRSNAFGTPSRCATDPNGCIGVPSETSIHSALPVVNSASESTLSYVDDDMDDSFEATAKGASSSTTTTTGDVPGDTVSIGQNEDISSPRGDDDDDEDGNFEGGATNDVDTVLEDSCSSVTTSSSCSLSTVEYVGKAGGLDAVCI